MKIVTAMSVGLLALACDQARPLGEAEVRATQEEALGGGALFTPNTQSFLRGHHWLDGVRKISITADKADRGGLELHGAGHTFSASQVPLQQLVPRLHYQPKSPPDAFDGFNLMLAEYSRNGLSLPSGVPDDTQPHFETDLPEGAPWTLSGDYAFVPNGTFKPLRFSVINNCLHPGLWELSARDRAGELYHGWFDFPRDQYVALIARANHLPEAFVTRSIDWNTTPARADLDRLRQVAKSYGPQPTRMAPDADIGFSSQGSRRKLSRGFAQVEGADGRLAAPTRRSELTQRPVHLVNFAPPGRYEQANRRRFDLRFLGKPTTAEVRQVAPKTHYRAAELETVSWPAEALEIQVHLGDGYDLVLGNLPQALMVPQEEFIVFGFGVGILAAGDLAERRALLFERGPAPAFAYLLRAEGEGQVAVNSHELGVEEIYVRALVDATPPVFEITVTSFERIVDLARLHVQIPPELVAPLREGARRYISPVWRTYRDDNIR